MNKIGWIIFSTVVLLLLGGLVAWTRITNPPIDVSNVENNSVIVASTQNGSIADHTEGSESNKILLVEYGDYQCPGCGGAYPNLNTLMEEYSDNVTLVFRNFPLTTIHPNARAAAAVAEAAGLQDKYWEMHNLLYENQDDWSNLDTTQRTTIFNSYAKDIELDVNKFQTDISSKDVTAKINFDLAMGKKMNISGTPTFFLNGTKLDSATTDGLIQGNLTLIKEQLDALIQ
jgi:protein-disulfide isomerase